MSATTTKSLNSNTFASSLTDSSSLPLVVYGELSILGYNGYIPNVERNGRRNRSKFLLCKRLIPNGIKKSRHYIVKEPNVTKAINDRDLHSISYTFSRSQTIIVEYRQDDSTDMFQIGRSSEEPIDFVVVDTITATPDSCVSHSASHKNHSSNVGCSSSGSSNIRHNHRNENHANDQHSQDLAGVYRLHRQSGKSNDEYLQQVLPSGTQDHRNRILFNHRHPAQAVLLNYPQPNISNLPPIMADHFRHQNSSLLHHIQQQIGHSSGLNFEHFQMQSSAIGRSSGDNNVLNSNNEQSEQTNQSSRSNPNCNKRSYSTQSTISRFACRILVDRAPPYTARIYAAGFDSSKNIFLGEKATKWEQSNSIDGLTTNGVLLMHPKCGHFYEDSGSEKKKSSSVNEDLKNLINEISGDNSDEKSPREQVCSNINQELPGYSNSKDEDRSKGNSAQASLTNDSVGNDTTGDHRNDGGQICNNLNDSNNNSDLVVEKRSKNQTESKENTSNSKVETGGVWREVSVDGGIYAIRESRSAIQKGVKIESENNVLQDGTLIDLCGATLLWRSVDGFKASPTKKSLEEKIDLLNASRPQCPVGLNTLVIPRKPIIPNNHQHRTSSKHYQTSNKDTERSSHQPYVYLKCGHVQGYHDWGVTDNSNKRTCPICLSVGNVAKLSMGLEPSFYVDSGPLTHVFSPCGHMASEKTIKYWCSIQIPHGTHFFHSVCPFCATPLATKEPASTRLIFQDDLD